MATFRKYEEVAELLRHYLDGYAYHCLDGDERERWKAEFDTHEAARRPHFAGCWAPEKIPTNLGEFLD